MAKTRTRKRNRTARMRKRLSYLPEEALELRKELQRARGPKFDSPRDTVTCMSFDAEAWSVDTDIVAEIVIDVFHELGEPEDTVQWTLEPFVGCAFNMHWGEHHQRIVDWNFDTVMAKIRYPHTPGSPDEAFNSAINRLVRKGVPEPEAEVENDLKIWEETIRNDDGVHPRRGHILLWMLTTVPKTHSIRRVCADVAWHKMPTFRLSQILKALVVIELHLRNEITEAFRGKVSTNEPDVMVEYLTLSEDIRAA